MSSYDNQNPYASYGAVPAYLAEESERTAFIRRTYAHLAGAVALFVAIETLIFSMVPQETLARMVTTMVSGYAWLGVMLAFIAVSWVADYWARSGASQAMQYAGLVLYVLAQSVIFVPMLAMTMWIDPSLGILRSAGILTAIVFGGLTAMVFVTRADFSWLGRFLFWAAIVAFGAVVCFVLAGSDGGLGVIFSVAMIALASGYILFHTSNVLHHYGTEQHVAAALALFASVALLFWYILRLFMSLQRD